MRSSNISPRSFAPACALALMVGLGLGEASAQEAPSPVAAQVQLYTDALARGDLVAAEAAAGAALTAAEERDAAVGQIAPLAFNLARVRVQLGRWQEASGPARRAYDLARRHGAGVDALMAELLWGRVRLASEGLHGADFLTRALRRAEERADLLGDRYDAAEQLALWATQGNSHLIARSAWAFAADAASGAPYDAQFARGRAKAYEGISIALQSVTRDPVMTSQAAADARARFIEAYPLLLPYAMIDAPDGQLTAPQDVYAQMLAWDAAIWSKMTSENDSRRGDDMLDANPLAFRDAPACAIGRISGAGLSYPVQQGREGQLGAVVIRLRFSADGAYLSQDVAAAVGDVDFERRVREAAATWTFGAAMGNCVVPAVYFSVITFYMQR